MHPSWSVCGFFAGAVRRQRRSVRETGTGRHWLALLSVVQPQYEIKRGWVIKGVAGTHRRPGRPVDDTGEWRVPPDP